MTKGRYIMGQVVLQGKYNTAIVYTENIEQGAISQIIELCNQEFVKDSKIRIMPDTHAGAGCTIGTTMTIKDKLVPNLVGVDIGCGMETVKLNVKELHLEELDRIIHTHIPAGFDIRKTPHKYVDFVNLDELKCVNHINKERAILSIGTLGGGNHFIEVDKDDDGYLYLVVHTGSRNLGKQAAEYYQHLAFKELNSRKEKIQTTVARLKADGRDNEIQSEIEKVKSTSKISKDLAYVSGESFDHYLHDMRIIQRYADLNRKAIVFELLKHMGLERDIEEQFTTIHNYIDTEMNILRKGAVRALSGEKLLIPINMRDGSLICVGKGNPDWNYSAPHGAGRLMSRSKAKEKIRLDDFVKSMNGIFSTTVNRSTIDEAPMAYKPMEEIMDNIQDTVDVVKVIKPIYNFKAAE